MAKRIRYSDHLKLRLSRRRIPRSLPRSIYRRAKEVFYDHTTGHLVAVARSRYGGRLREMMVAYSEVKDEVTLITVHPLKPRQKTNRIASGRWIPHEEKKNKPLVNYDPSSDVLYIATRKGVEEEFTEVAPGVNVETDDRGNVLGVEILRASHTLKGIYKIVRKNAMRPNVGTQRAADIQSSDRLVRSCPRHFGFSILRLSSVQVLGFPIVGVRNPPVPV